MFWMKKSLVYLSTAAELEGQVLLYSSKQHNAIYACDKKIT